MHSAPALAQTTKKSTPKKSRSAPKKRKGLKKAIYLGPKAKKGLKKASCPPRQRSKKKTLKTSTKKKRNACKKVMNKHPMPQKRDDPSPFLKDVPLVDKTLSKCEINKAIREFFQEHPEELKTALEKAVLKESDQRRAQRYANLKKYEKALYTPCRWVPAFGECDAPNKIILFADPLCPHSNRSIQSLLSFVEKHDNFQFTLRYVPTLGNQSKIIGMALIAAHLQECFSDFYDAVENRRRDGKPLTEDDLIDIADELRMDLKGFIKDINKKVLADQIECNLKTALDLGMEGTPLIVFKDQIIPGYVPASKFLGHASGGCE
eukprot:g8351.t1